MTDFKILSERENTIVVQISKRKSANQQFNEIGGFNQIRSISWCINSNQSLVLRGSGENEYLYLSGNGQISYYQQHNCGFSFHKPLVIDDGELNENESYTLVICLGRNS